MENQELEKLKYPLGRFVAPETVSRDTRASMLADIERLPSKIRAAISGLTSEQISTPYRDGGWTSHQVVHHVADSHANAFVRFKLALTQPRPTILPYDQAKWAEMADCIHTPVQASLSLLEGLHARWTTLLSRMSDADFACEYFYPEQNRAFRLDVALALYSWHSRHHVAQITGLRERKGW